MNAALDALFGSIEAHHPRTGWLDVAALVIILAAGFCVYSYCATPGDQVFAFFAEEANAR